MSGRDLTPEPDDADQPPSRWSEGAVAHDPTQQRIAALWGKLPPPADLPAARLSAVRARLPGRTKAPRARALRPWAWALAALLLLLGSGVVAAARGWVAWVHLRPVATAPASMPAPLALTRPRARIAPAVTPEAPDEPNLPNLPVAPVAPAIAPPSPRRSPAPTPVPAPVAVATPVPSDSPAPPQTEASVLESAVAVLRRQGDARAALRMLDGYDDRFAHGLLAPEADRLRIDAWLVLGDRRRALQRLNQVALSDGARDLELLLIRGELRVALAGCAGAPQDFARVLARISDPALIARARAGVAACARAGAGGAR